MPLNKIQLKAKLFGFIKPVRNLNAIDDGIVSKTLDKIKSIKDADFEFIARILIKEADIKNPKSASAFLYMAENLAPESFQGLILNELNSNKTTDSRKMFFLNVLSGFGVKFRTEDIGGYLKNPDEAINNETSRFLECAKIDPEAQIDFLDFYFASDISDRRELVDSVTGDFEGDRLINILSPLVLSAEDSETVNYCLEIMEKEKSLISVKPLTYLSSLKPDSKIQKKASKILRKMSLSGFYTEEKLYDFYCELLSDYEPPEVQISLPDGNSNFSVVISRKTKGGACFLLFAAVNIELGPFSCFGFSSLTESDSDNIIRRFFSSCERFFVPASEIKTILTSLTLKRISLRKIVPYEYFCWERLIDDVMPDKRDIREILTEDVKKVEINDFKHKIIFNSPFVENWFYRYSKSAPYFTSLVDEILKLNKFNISKIEDLIIEASKNKELKSNIEKRICYLVYCFKSGGHKDLAGAFYSLLYDEKEFNLFVVEILKRSVYEYALLLKMPMKSGDILFKKTTPTAGESKAALLTDYIETNWIRE